MASWLIVSILLVFHGFQFERRFVCNEVFVCELPRLDLFTPQNGLLEMRIGFTKMCKKNHLEVD